MFPDGLPTRILEDTGTEPGALALLAFALHELYQARTPGGELAAQAYDSFGGVKRAIGKRAEAAFEKLPPASKPLLNNVFRELVDVNELGVSTRRRAELARVASTDDTRVIIDAFAAAHLLITDRQPDGTPVVEVAHEALLREWPRLAGWIRRFIDDLRTMRQAEAAAAEWARSNRLAIQLWPHERLVPVYAALEQLGIDPASLRDPVKTFLRPEAERLLDELEFSKTTPPRRAEIGDRLDRIGDPRPGVQLRADGLPDIVWCNVPGGTVRLKGANGKFTVKPFAIAKYLVTYNQYKVFLDDRHGYRDKRWWSGLTHKKPGEQYRPTGNCPADCVSWYDAVAFCRWLDARLRDRGEVPTGYEVRLPTEPEWQQAFTSGCATYRYPWGEVIGGVSSAPQKTERIRAPVAPAAIKPTNVRKG